MLTGDISVTKGDAYINQHSIVDDILAARQSMGYCPQFDALNDLLTAREHLELYARIRGIQEEDVSRVCKKYCFLIDCVIVLKLALQAYVGESFVNRERAD